MNRFENMLPCFLELFPTGPRRHRGPGCSLFRCPMLSMLEALEFGNCSQEVEVGDRLGKVKRQMAFPQAKTHQGYQLPKPRPLYGMVSGDGQIKQLSKNG